MRRVHLFVGVCGLVAFVASGAYMRFRVPPMGTLNEATRLLYRSTHIYLLFAALLNLVFGLSAEPASHGWRVGICRIGSALVVLAPVLCVMAFLNEPWLTGLKRPYTVPAVVCSLAGVLCHVAGK